MWINKPIREGKSFRRLAIKQWWVDAPKNYWVIGAFIGLIGSQSILIAAWLSKDKPEKQQIELQVKYGIRSDTITVYQSPLK